MYNISIITLLKEVHVGLQSDIMNSAGLGRNDIEQMLIGSECLPSVRLNYFLGRGLIALDCPELINLVDCEQGEEHHPEGDVWSHALLALDTAYNMGLREWSDLPVLLAVLLHDTGKFETARFDHHNSTWSFNGHDAAGIPIARGFLERFGFDEFIPEVLPLIREHMMLYQMRDKATGLLKDDNLTPKAILSLAMRLFPATIEQLMDHIRCDKMGQIDEFAPDFEKLEELARQLGVFDSASYDMLSNYDFIAACLGLEVEDKKVWSLISKLRKIEQKKEEVFNTKPAYA